MEMFKKDECISEKNEVGLKYNTFGVPGQQFGSSVMSLVVSSSTSVAIAEGNQICPSVYPSVSMVDSFSPWNLSTTLENWNPTETRTNCPQAHPGFVPSILSHITDNSNFIERTTRFSCFTAGVLGGNANQSTMCEPQTLNSPISASEIIIGSQFHRTESDMIGNIDDKGDELINGTTMKEQNISRNLICQSNECVKLEKMEVSRENEETLVHTDEDSSLKEGMPLVKVQGLLKISSKTNEDIIAEKKEQQNRTTSTSKLNTKRAKTNSEESKEEYIHIRARRGQATTSHSLAERIRRERISERMKFLQDLVPGCNKVTGKAVMLDEIINYVQSLQRQVEFLSMKLAAVNPRTDLNIAALLSKHLLQYRHGDFSEIGFSHSVIQHRLHSSQQGLYQNGLPSLIGTSETLERALLDRLDAMNGPALQNVTTWDGGYNNSMEMSYNNHPTISTQEYNYPTQQDAQI